MDDYYLLWLRKVQRTDKDKLRVLERFATNLQEDSNPAKRFAAARVIREVVDHDTLLRMQTPPDVPDPGPGIDLVQILRSRISDVEEEDEDGLPIMGNFAEP